MRIETPSFLSQQEPQKYQDLPDTVYTFLFDIYKNSFHGQLLSQHVRFWTFMPESESPEHWQKILGNHVNNLWHLMETYKDTEAFIKAQGMDPQKRQFSDREAHLLRLYAVLHDMAEVIIGDTPDTQKAGKVYAMNLEMAVLDHIVDTLYKKEYPSIAFDMHEAIDAIGRGKDEFLKESFRTIECIGYATVAIQAEEYIPYAETDALRDGLGHLVVSVGKRGYSEVQRQTDRFVFARQFVDQYDQFFTEALLVHSSSLAS